ncbi:MAG: hypothetical protein ACHQNT_03450 [Bacteroidia bacterium]
MPLNIPQFIEDLKKAGFIRFFNVSIENQSLAVVASRDAASEAHDFVTESLYPEASSCHLAVASRHAVA